MKYTLVKRIKFNHSNDCVSVIKEADSLEDALKFKVGAEMLDEPSEDKVYEVLININDAFDYIKEPAKPLLLTDEVKGQKAS